MKDQHDNPFVGSFHENKRTLPVNVAHEYVGMYEFLFIYCVLYLPIFVYVY